MRRSRPCLRIATVSLATLSVGTLSVGVCPHSGIFVPCRNAVAAEGIATVDEDLPEAEVVEIATSDGVTVVAWYYAPQAAGEGNTPGAATPVIIVHDLLNSHESVEPLALALQGKGMAVICPDLRGHGESSLKRAGPATGRKDSVSVDADQLRKADLEAIATVTGGTVRDQAAVQGDLEVVRAWLAAKAGDGSIDMEKLCVVGSGFGATLAALWAANDWAWGERPLASGPQGRFIRGLVFVSPEWSSKGVSFTPLLASPALRGGIPLLVLGGTGDRDAAKLFDQLKRLQPDSWAERKAGGHDWKWASQLTKSSEADLFSIQLATTLSGDELASDASGSAANDIAGFINLATRRRAK